MNLTEIIGEYAVVSKVDARNINASKKWYEEKLGLVPDPRFDVPNSWTQLRIPGIPRTYVGLNQSNEVGTGGAVLTFVVDDIVPARDALIKNGVPVGPIEDVGKGVRLAFFKDPDGNALGLRQNPLEQPRVASM